MFCTATCRGNTNAHQSQQVLNENVCEMVFSHLPWIASGNIKIGVCVQIVITKNNPVKNNSEKTNPVSLKSSGTVCQVVDWFL